MESAFVPVLDDKILKELARVEKRYPHVTFDISIALNGCFWDPESDYGIIFGPESPHLLAEDALPEVEAMRAACASGNLESVQSTFEIYWLDRPVNERKDKNTFGAGGLCEGIKRDDVVVG